MLAFPQMIPNRVGLIRLVRARATAERLPTYTSAVYFAVVKAYALKPTYRARKYVFLLFPPCVWLTLAVLDVFVIVWSQEHLLTLGASQHVVTMSTDTVVMIQPR